MKSHSLYVQDRKWLIRSAFFQYNVYKWRGYQNNLRTCRRANAHLQEKWEDRIAKSDWNKSIGLTMLITMLITIIVLRSILFYSVYLDDNALLQCRIGLIMEVILIGIVNPFSHFFHNLILSFFPKGFCACIILQKNCTV